MTMLLSGIGIGIIVAALLALALIRAQARKRGGARDMRTDVHASIEDLRALGSLSVFKVVTKEIVTARDHWLGDWGKRYLEWLTSSRKMAMIFAFDIDFRYDLRSSDFAIEDKGDGRFRLRMPRGHYDIHIRDITFYDEQKARFLPWLMPDVLNSVFGAGFDEDDRNRLKEEARRQAESLAANLAQRLQSEVQTSARETMEILARGFGARHVTVAFNDSQPERAETAFEAEAEATA